MTLQRTAWAIVVVFICTCILIPAHSQQRDHKSYVAAGMGPSVRLNGYRKAWANQPFFEVGVELGSGFGIVGTWIGGNYLYKEDDFYYDGSQWTPIQIETKINYAFLSLGPMYVIRLDRRSSIDLKARVGRYRYFDMAKGPNVNFQGANRSLGYYFSGTYQYRWLPSWTLLMSLDYATNRPDFNFESYGSMSTLSLSLGVGFRL